MGYENRKRELDELTEEAIALGVISKGDVIAHDVGRALKNGFENTVEKPVSRGIFATLFTVLGLTSISSGCTTKTKTAKTAAEQSIGNRQTLDEILKKPECESLIDQKDKVDKRHYTEGRKGHSIEYIVFHVTQGVGSGALKWLTTGNTDNGAHYLIMEDGKIWQLVDEKNSAHHSGDTDKKTKQRKPWNYKSIGIEIAGFFDKEINDAQKKSLAKLASHLLRKYNLNFDAVKGHNDLVEDRQCPGINKEIGKAAIKEYIMGLQLASADKSKLLGAPMETTVAAAYECAQFQVSSRILSEDRIVRETVVYTVHEKETDWSIARSYGLMPEDLERENGRSLEKIHPGEKIKIPALVMREGELDIRIGNELAPTISVGEIEKQIIDYELAHSTKSRRIKSPLAAKEIYSTAVAYGIDPRFVSAICMYESGFGTGGLGAKNKNPGNIKLTGKEFAKYSTFAQGIEGLCRRLRDDYVSKGRYTVENIMPSYAPAFENNTKKYIAFIRGSYEIASGVKVASQKPERELVSVSKMPERELVSVR